MARPGRGDRGEESGARFVYRDQKLHPVLNYASALLIVGADRSKTVLVSRRTIDGVPRGLPLGIADAPDSLPAPAGWPPPDGPSARPSRPARAPRRPLRAVDRHRVRGRPVARRRRVAAAPPDGGLHLVWHQRRYLVRDSNRVLAALATTRAQAVPVAPALLNALPAGADLARSTCPHWAGPPPGCRAPPSARSTW
ncbi:type VII secretion protein EccB [Micromonospora sp. M12]